MIPALVVAVACAPSKETAVAVAGPSITDVSLFQAVEVPLWASGALVASSDRTAPVVAARDAVVRARVDVPADFAGGDLTLEITVATDATQSFQASAPAGEDLVVSIPASALPAGASWSARLLEGGTEHDRVGATPLDAVETGPLKIKLIPFEVNGFVPDTSAAVVEGYRAALWATYPVTEVSISVGDVVPWAGEADLGDINVEVGVLQERAMFAGTEGWDVYYYGMVTGVATRDEFEGITGTSEGGASGETPVRAYFAAGAAFADDLSEDTLIHEIGHTHRLMHTPCDGEDDPDPDYPYEGGVIGVEGYDLRTGTFVSADSMDLMTYCYPRWVSDYSYAKLAAHVALAQTFEGYD